MRYTFICEVGVMAASTTSAQLKLFAHWTGVNMSIDKYGWVFQEWVIQLEGSKNQINTFLSHVREYMRVNGWLEK